MAQTNNPKATPSPAGGIAAAAKAAMPGGNQAASKPKPKKKKNPIPALIILFIVLAGGFLFASIQFNLFSFRQILVDTVYSLDPEFKAVETIQTELDLREEALAERESTIAADEERLALLKEQLDEKESELESQELNSLPIYLRPLSEEELANMKSLSKVYSEMAAEDAAGILSALYSNEDMAAILYYMPEKSSAAILAAMEVSLAADITDLLLHY